MAVTLTERAAKHVAALHREAWQGRRPAAGVRTTGCSGMAYKLEYADAPQPEDQQFESHGVRSSSIRRAWPTSTAPNSTSCAKGLNEGFKFNNPQEKNRCGCGESFNV